MCGTFELSAFCIMLIIMFGCKVHGHLVFIIPTITSYSTVYKKGKKEVSEQKRKEKEKKETDNDKSREEEDDEERMEEEPEVENDAEEEDVEN